MQTYELVAILDPRMDVDQAAAAVAKIENAVTSGDGELIASEAWGVRRLAYPIKQFREGNYILRRFKIEPSEAISLNQTLRMAEEVIRHLVVKVDNAVEKTVATVDSAVEETAVTVDSAVEETVVTVDSAVEETAATVDSAVEETVVTVDSAVEETAATVDNDSKEA